MIARFARFDREAILALPRIRHAALNPLVVALTFTGSGFLWYPFAAFMIFAQVKRACLLPQHELLLACMLGAYFSVVTGQVLKRIVRRDRPAVAVEGHRVIGMNHRDFAMPSTHTSHVVAVAAGFAVHGHPWWPFAAPWACAVMLSRYYLGVHYPTDLAVGALLGAVFGIFDWSSLTGALFG